MYFQKPADALTTTGGDGSTVGAVAQANVPDRGPVAAVPDAVASTLPPPPPPPTSRYFPANTTLNPPPAVVIPPVTPVSNEQPNPQPAPPVQLAPVQPTEPIAQPFTAQKKAQPIPPVPEEYIKLPARENVFLTYDNLQLEKAIMERLREDLKKDKKYTPDQERYLVFPPLPIISPPGVAYQAKTATYAPKQAALEPNYLVHRRLYFEEKNAERTGWDMGPLQVLVSAGYFWRDTLLVPQTLASGCVYGFWDTSVGKCFPGSPSPYFLYPPGLTVTGTVAEGVVVTGLSFIFH